MSLEEYTILKKFFNNNIQTILSNFLESEELINMIMYCLEDGKRLRPIIALDICNSLTKDLEKGLKFSLAIELIHNASLIIDDLPCMDDDDFRRNKLSFHKKYSESIAQIVSAELLGIATKLIIESFNKTDLGIILEIVSTNLGLLGAASGQLVDVTPLDLHKNKKEIIKKSKRKDEIKDLINKKTTTFFEIAFLGGFILGGGNIDLIDKIKELANNFGLAFQIYDDFDDIEQDNKRNDSKLEDQNFINNFGKEDAFNEFNENISLFRKDIKKYSLDSKLINELCNFLECKVKKKYNNI